MKLSNSQKQRLELGFAIATEEQLDALIVEARKTGNPKIEEIMVQLVAAERADRAAERERVREAKRIFNARTRELQLLHETNNAALDAERDRRGREAAYYRGAAGRIRAKIAAEDEIDLASRFHVSSLGIGSDERCEVCSRPGTPADPLVEVVVSPPVSGVAFQTARLHSSCAAAAAEEAQS